MIRVLIVEDSDTAALLIRRIIESDPEMTVIGIARNGKEAVDFTLKLLPDIITMDILMPVMDGLEATKIIVSRCPTPIVVISSTLNDKSVQATFPILEAGALSALAKPKSVLSPDFEDERKRILNTLRAMAGIKVARRRFKTSEHKKIADLKPVRSDYELIAIGVSVGGPMALKTILSGIDENYRLPIVIVQHMSPGFIEGYASWLNDCSKIPVKAAISREPLEPGHVYLAPDGKHLNVDRVGTKLYTNLVAGGLIDGFCPSITSLMRSVAKTCGSRAVAGLLTGMGSDGATGLIDVEQSKGVTFIQDSESAVVFGMAAVAQSLGATARVIELANIADYLNEVAGH